MFVYEKKLQYPVRIANTNPKLASIVISQYGGPDGELGASLRYLSQRFAMPFPELKGLLTDIGTEELGHLEMVGAIVHQLTRNLTDEQMKEDGFAQYFVDHTAGVYPDPAAGGCVSDVLGGRVGRGCHPCAGDAETAEAFAVPAGDADDYRLLSACDQGLCGADPRCGQLLFGGRPAE